jgi:glycogen debranching enzyme
MYVNAYQKLFYSYLISNSLILSVKDMIYVSLKNQPDSDFYYHSIVLIQQINYWMNLKYRARSFIGGSLVIYINEF